MRHLRSVLTVCFLAASLAAPARAGEPERKAVLGLVHVVLPETLYQQMLDQVTTQLFATFKANGATLPKDAPSRIKAAVQEALPYDDVAAWTADIYQSRFTLEEIKQLLEFYQTPVGQKVARLLPEIAGESAKRVGQILPAR